MKVVIIFNIFLYTQMFSICAAQNNVPLFKSLSPEKTKIDFVNEVIENDTFNYFYYDNIYNGGGVAAGDLNNDGLPDLYFISNVGPDQLYLNLGKMRFKNITKKAFSNQDESGWHSAVSFADVNADGWLDIYVCKHGLGPQQKVNYRNLLYLNNHNNTFTECGNSLGLDDPGRSMDADFFDYDQDGDLDLFVSNHRENTCVMDQFNHVQYLEQFHSNRLYRNDDGKFVDVTKSAGVLSFGFCLSAAISDLNNDGWPDIYVTSDYNLPDFLFINQRNGEFKNESKERLRHTSHYSMGIDIADFNNDAFSDVCVLDMSNRDYVKSKTNMGSMSLGTFLDNVAKGFNYQYMYNTLQLNHGNGYFSEIAHMSGIASTDWSWAPLLADFDQDGYKDIFVTNGYFRDVRDRDFTNKLKNYMASNPDVFDVQKMLNLIPQSKEINYFFKNKKDLTFENKTADWGITNGSNSNGAAYADLDNDGDLDIIINNLNEPATVLENTLENKKIIKVKLMGPQKNPFAFGAKIIVKTNNGNQVQELNPSRGYASSSDLVFCFGLVDIDKVDEISVVWNAKESTTISSPKTNQTLVIDYGQSIKDDAPTIFPLPINEAKKFAKVKSIDFDDFKTEVLLPQKMSSLGPFLSKSDVNLDGKEDLFVAGNRGESARIFLQTDNGFILSRQPALEQDAWFEDGGAVFFDADNDGDADLYITAGGNEEKEGSDYYSNRFYLNNGDGLFERDTISVPKIKMSGQCALVNDFDNDGDMDLFIPGRQVPGKYLQKPESFWLVNNQGKFENKINTLAPELQFIGMVTDAIFTDINHDKKDELILVGEWMKPMVFENHNGKFEQIQVILDEDNLFGWWNCITPIDINNDGTNEYLLGNLGLNNKFHPSSTLPLNAELHDFDNNGTLDFVLSKYFGGVLHPVRGRECLSEQIPSISKRFGTYSDFAATPYNVMFSGEGNKEKVNNFSNGMLILENGKYAFHSFENRGQIGCFNAFIPVKINADEYVDFIAFGNKYEAEIETPRYDANPGLVFLNKGNGTFTILPLEQDTPYVNQNAKDAVLIGRSIFISNADESINRYELF